MPQKTIKDLLADWRASEADMKKLVAKLPRIIGNESVKVVQDNFRLQGYDSGTGVTKWAERSTATNAIYDGRSKWVKGSVYSSTRRLLEQTMALFNGIKYEMNGPNKVRTGVELNLVPYAQWVNEGVTDGKIGPHHYHTETPPRQYMPKPGEPANPKIMGRVYKKVEYEIDHAMKRFKK